MPPRFGDGAGTSLNANDETTPLLVGNEAAPLGDSADPSRPHPPADESPTSEEETDADEDKPLPRAQIFLLCYTRVVEPIAFFGIFPYINFMIEKVGNIPKEEVGFYSGLIESLFSATQMCLMIFWGRVRSMPNNRLTSITNRYRRPIVTEGNQSSSARWSVLLLLRRASG
jgi:hypothetical protein